MFEEYGFRHPKDLVLSFIGGSQLHGAKIEGTDDKDWYGVFIELPTIALGLDADSHFVWTSGGKRGGNGPNDVDVCLYGLKKWAGLAAKGNPSVLHFLFALPEFQSMVWARFAWNKDLFLAKRHIKSYMGFANDQLRRLLGEKGQKNIHRAELEGEHGYDTKYAMHIIRLYNEAIELMSTGKITLPRPEAKELIAIRKGKYTLSHFKEYALETERFAKATAEKSQLPEEVDRKAISRLVAKAYIEHWQFRKVQLASKLFEVDDEDEYAAMEKEQREFREFSLE